MSMDPRQLRDHVIEPVLDILGMRSRGAIALILGTAAAESDMGRYIVQLQSGPARGIYQMEPATERDCWRNYLDHRRPLADAVRSLVPTGAVVGDGVQLTWSLAYATAMARVQYKRSPRLVGSTPEEHAAMWKEVWNTRLGAGTMEGFLAAWKRHGLDGV